MESLITFLDSDVVLNYQACQFWFWMHAWWHLVWLVTRMQVHLELRVVTFGRSCIVHNTKPASPLEFNVSKFLQLWDFEVCSPLTGCLLSVLDNGIKNQHLQTVVLPLLSFDDFTKPSKDYPMTFLWIWLVYKLVSVSASSIICHENDQNHVLRCWCKELMLTNV